MNGGLGTNNKEHIAKISLKLPNEYATANLFLWYMCPSLLISTTYVCVCTEGTEENHISQVTGCQADKMLTRMDVSVLARPFSTVLALLLSKSVLSKTNTMQAMEIILNILVTMF